MVTQKKHLNVAVLSSQCDVPNAKTDGKENNHNFYAQKICSSWTSISHEALTEETGISRKSFVFSHLIVDIQHCVEVELHPGICLLVNLLPTLIKQHTVITKLLQRYLSLKLHHTRNQNITVCIDPPKR